MEQEVLETKKKGNPNFGAKKVKEEVNQIEEDVNKIHHFVLTQSWEKYKPVDNESGRMDKPPYPPMYQLPSEGITVDDETGKNKRWRCLKGVDTIWVDEQDGLEPNGFEDYEEIIFINGQLKVRGYEVNKLMALKSLDTFEGKKYKKVNSKPVYRLIDLDADLNNALDNLDLEYEALKIAKECSDDEMLPFAFVLGLNVEGSPRSVRKDFIMKAKSNPKYFLKYFVDPKNEIAFKVHKAITENIISTSAIEGKLVWTESRKVIMDAPKGADLAQDVAKLVMQNDDEAIKLFEQLKKM
jgi:hypothetical protein